MQTYVTHDEKARRHPVFAPGRCLISENSIRRTETARARSSLGNVGSNGECRATQLPRDDPGVGMRQLRTHAVDAGAERARQMPDVEAMKIVHAVNIARVGREQAPFRCGQGRFPFCPQ